jgi:plastocyanin
VRRVAGSGAVLVAAMVAVAVLGGSESHAALAATAPARLQVGADEFRYTLSRLRIRAGTAIVQLVNYGEDDHNLRLRREGRKYVHRLPRTAPGEMSELRTVLRAGRYKLWCSLSGHEAAGMKASLRVFRP